ncbi:FAD-binding protein [Metarhizium robertsii ARSEF 23]|uniref:FAD-binding protein n=1 Tax=Metarhizium robertsii (strain ARSEF 23 / ATCC MYA-3075) TaxID=655844 RepID=E9EK10_METRA|nr:FAD-binding protein [Metarhizium robertsii ARSEF 23]EFZ03021.2 FAD-binding protein [Metarhizium robertsii ARSEF 23]
MLCQQQDNACAIPTPSLIVNPSASDAADFSDIQSQGCTTSVGCGNFYLNELSALLSRQNIQAHHTRGQFLPTIPQMHDRAAPLPHLIVSPKIEGEVVQTLRAFKRLRLYGRIPLSVKSGGHGYFNGASCTGVMLNLSAMTGRRVDNNTLLLEPGCLLAGSIDMLAKNQKAVPHGDCFGVGAGGHFLTAGWDLILARHFGLGCQSVVGGRVVLWDGTVLEVDDNHAELLYAMRGGAAAGQLATCIKNNAFANSLGLPRDVSVSFRFHFEPDTTEPVCSFNIVSLLTAEETINILETHLGQEVFRLVDDTSRWQQRRLLELRLIPALDHLKKNPTRLADVTQEDLHNNPLDYWTESSTKREMDRSYFTSISYWVRPNCEDMFNDLYHAFEEVPSRHPARERMYALVILGGGRMNELQDQCAMPLGEALARFELHWDDDAKERRWSERFTAKISEILRSVEDPSPGRPYRGDVWIEGQDRDATLDAIFKIYDRRFV